MDEKNKGRADQQEIMKMNDVGKKENRGAEGCHKNRKSPDKKSRQILR